MSVVVLAPAKLTLTLHVTGTRADGFHLLEAEMVSLTLADVLTIEPELEGLTMTGPCAAGLPCGEDNLVQRALRLAGRTARVEIDKRIPPGGGLGGGSADAAAILRWAGWTDLVAASRLGADVPFCLVGGRACVRGIGEQVTVLAPERRDVTLVVPPLTCSTPQVYAVYDELARSGAGPRHAGAARPANDLEAAALIVEPRLVGWRDRIAEACGVAPTLAGSGSTWFVGGHHPELLTALPDATVILTTTTPTTTALEG